MADALAGRWQVVMYEVYSCGRVPFEGLSTVEVLSAVAAGRRLDRPSPATPEEGYELLRNCTQAAATQRPTMAAVRGRLEVLRAALSPTRRSMPQFVSLDVPSDADTETAL
jgi:hypothetical protein